MRPLLKCIRRLNGITNSSPPRRRKRCGGKFMAVKVELIGDKMICLPECTWQVKGLDAFFEMIKKSNKSIESFFEVSTENVLEGKWDG
jgi:hypothetical protein